jgi:hypothetical protein
MANRGNPPANTPPLADVTVTDSDLSNFELYAQYSAAAYCNSEVASGTNITCSEDACPDVESAGAVVTATFALVETRQ